MAIETQPKPTTGTATSENPGGSASATPATVPTRRRRGKRSREESEIGVLNLAEQAFHLLRTTPLAHLWLYYLGTVPFVLGAFFFWADMSRSSHAARDAAFGSLALAGVWLWMKFWQGRFCRALWQQLHPSGNRVDLETGRQGRYLAAQAFVHAFALPVTLVSSIFLGWTVAFFQNATVLAFTQDFGRQPLRQVIRQSAALAQRNWMQNYLVLLVVLVLSLFIWLNLLGASVLIPMALKAFLGVETVFTLSPMHAILNTTFLFGTTLLAYLVIDPLLKAIYTLRCFRGLSRQTGADLLSRLDRAENERPLRPGGGSASAALTLALLLCAASPSASAQETTPETPSAAELSESIEETLRDKVYQWRLPRQAIEEAEDGSESWLAKTMNDLADAAERTIKSIGEAIERMFRKLFEGRRSAPSGPDLGAAGAGAGIALLAKILFIALIVGLVAWIVTLVVGKRRGEKEAEVEDVELAGPIDLESDAIVATQLPEDEWMRLAREQIAKGEHRLAIRALFLASLANLGERGLLRVARFKSNRDYTRELRLKARSLPELQDAFQENVGLFERVWYGLHEIGRDAIDRFTANYERITLEPTGPGTAAGGQPASS